MKLYVDELPKSCGECFCDIENTWCALSDGEMGDICEECDNKTRHKKCPLKTLADYTKQVRQEVLDQVRDIARKIARPTTEYDGGEFDYDIDGVTLGNLLIWLEDEEFDLIKNFLDQIQGESL